MIEHSCKYLDKVLDKLPAASDIYDIEEAIEQARKIHSQLREANKELESTVSDLKKQILELEDELDCMKDRVRDMEGD